MSRSRSCCTALLRAPKDGLTGAKAIKKVAFGADLHKRMSMKMISFLMSGIDGDVDVRTLELGRETRDTGMTEYPVFAR